MKGSLKAKGDIEEVESRERRQSKREKKEKSKERREGAINEYDIGDRERKWKKERIQKRYTGKERVKRGRKYSGRKV